MPFPINPNNNDTYTASTGTVYRYVSSKNAWEVDKFATSGTTGLQGLTGAQGATGTALGVTGLPGTTGSQGATGVAAGPTGLQGATGLAGQQGASLATGSFDFIMAGGEDWLLTGIKGYFTLPFNISVRAYEMYASETGSAYLELRRTTHANFQTIETANFLHQGETGPQLELQKSNQRTGLSTVWTQATGIYGDVIRAELAGVTGIKNITLRLDFVKL